MLSLPRPWKKRRTCTRGPDRLRHPHRQMLADAEIHPRLDGIGRIPRHARNPALLAGPPQCIAVIAAGFRPFKTAEIFLLDKIFIYAPRAFRLQRSPASSPARRLPPVASLLRLLDGQDLRKPRRDLRAPADTSRTHAPGRSA